jgi:hypothetical protein
VYVEGEAVPFLGTFDLGGVGTVKTNVYRKGLPLLPIRVAPIIDLTGNKLITGTVTNAGWLANLEADLKVWNLTNPPPSTMTGAYTMILPGSSVPGEPAGHGFGLVSVKNNLAGAPLVRCLGSYLGDGQAISLVVPPMPPSQEGRWPFYSKAYKVMRGIYPAYMGSAQGWLTFSNDNVWGDLTWQKRAGWTPLPLPVQPNLYPLGFSNVMTIEGSRYVAPVLLSGKHVIDITNSWVTLAGGNLPSPVGTNFLWNDLNKLRFVTTNNPNRITLTVTPTTGAILGAFRPNPAVTATVKIYGAVLQNGSFSNTAWGNFKGTSESGTMLIQAAP